MGGERQRANERTCGYVGNEVPPGAVEVPQQTNNGTKSELNTTQYNPVQPNRPPTWLPIVCRLFPFGEHALAVFARLERVLDTQRRAVGGER